MMSSCGPTTPEAYTVSRKPDFRLLIGVLTRADNYELRHLLRMVYDLQLAAGDLTAHVDVHGDATAGIHGLVVVHEHADGLEARVEPPRGVRPVAGVEHRAEVGDVRRDGDLATTRPGARRAVGALGVLSSAQ
uniref:Uncharacterized protein n=1 Tax=Oryza glumipatula TaxID=40148 RepID=A0A0E0AQB3_9ORYZ